MFSNVLQSGYSVYCIALSLRTRCYFLLSRVNLCSERLNHIRLKAILLLQPFQKPLLNELNIKTFNSLIIFGQFVLFLFLIFQFLLCFGKWHLKSDGYLPVKRLPITNNVWICLWMLKFIKLISNWVWLEFNPLTSLYTDMSYSYNIDFCLQQ